MYPYSKAQSARQVEAAAVKIQTVEIEKVCIHMHKVVAMWMRCHSVSQDGKQVSFHVVKKFVAAQLLRQYMGMTESSPQISLQIKTGKKKRGKKEGFAICTTFNGHTHSSLLAAPCHFHQTTCRTTPTLLYGRTFTAVVVHLNQFPGWQRSKHFSVFL